MARIARDHSYAPRGLRLPDAARWWGVGQTKFLELVESRRAPKPRRIDGVVVWDRYELDEAFDTLTKTGALEADHTWDDVHA
jgi:predicted DNA-binding transcriptional regulator AlpA